MKLLNCVVIASMLVAPLAALAQSTATPVFDQRQANQEQRIQQGAQSGSLTPREAARLERGQDRLQAREDRAKADGVVTNKERAGLQRAENRQSERIYREKHDAQHDFNHNGRVDRPHRPLRRVFFRAPDGGARWSVMRRAATPVLGLYARLPRRSVLKSPIFAITPASGEKNR